MVDPAKPANNMIYRYLGNTGLKVSVLSYGNMVSVIQGDKQKFMNDSVQRCLELGINYFDTAEMYNFGEAEVVLGLAFKDLKVKREEIVVSTKLFWGAGVNDAMAQINYYKGMGLNHVGLSRKHVIEGTVAALKRL